MPSILVTVVYFLFPGLTEEERAVMESKLVVLEEEVQKPYYFAVYDSYPIYFMYSDV